MNFKDTEIGRIPFEWDVRMIQDVAEVVSGATPKTKVAEYWDGNIAWITPKDLSNHTERYIYRGDRMITDEGLKNSSAKLLPKGSVLFSSRAPIGYTAITAQELCTNQGFKSMICNQQILDNNFMFYMMNYKKNEIENIAGGSTFKEVSGKTVKEFKIPIPPLDEQKAIAKVLSDLDEKIEINNKINKKLEEMAQAIFKQWFIDFEFPNEDGKQYKSSGGEMVESELGMIPKGWLVNNLGDLINIVDNRGKTPPQEKEKTEYPIIDVKALSGDSRVIDYNNCLKFVSKSTYENWFRSGHPADGDILMSTVGSLAELKIFYGNVGCIAQNVVALRSKGISNLYLYQYLKYIKNTLVSYNIGSVQPSIKITHVIKHKILIPNEEIINKYHNNLYSISQIIFNNSAENEKLISLRDTLLPKLMSGEIRVQID